MLKHAIFLLFLYGIKVGNCSPQNDKEGSKNPSNNGIKKNEIGANGLDYNSGDIVKNFRNPVLEYLLNKNPAGGKSGVVREIRHSQTLLIPNFYGGFGGPLSESMINQIAGLQSTTNFNRVLRVFLQAHSVETSIFHIVDGSELYTQGCEPWRDNLGRIENERKDICLLVLGKQIHL